MSNLLQFSISEALSLLKKKEFSTKELVETYINAIKKNNFSNTKTIKIYILFLRIYPFTILFN